MLSPEFLTALMSSEPAQLFSETRDLHAVSSTDWLGALLLPLF